MELEVVDAFRAAGVPEDKALAAAASLNRAIDQRYALHAAQLVTRSDLTAAISELKSELKLSMADLKVDVIKWCVGSLIAISAVFSTITLGALKLLSMH